MILKWYELPTTPAKGANPGKMKQPKPRGAAKAPKKSPIREYTEAIVFALLAALVLRAFVVQAFRIPTGSMKDTLKVGDFLLVNKFIYGARTPDRVPILDVSLPFVRLPAFKRPERGDIIVFKYPRDESLDYIKRLIAVGGQTVEMRDGDVYVDGKPEGEKTFLGREYDPEERHYVLYYRIKLDSGKEYTIRHYADHIAENEDFGPVVVPKGHFFMMGDNRDNSADSRVWGFLPMRNVIGEALIIYWSWDKFADITDVAHKVRWVRIGHLIR